MAGLTSNKDLNDLVKKAQGEGWTITRTLKGHLKWTRPGGGLSFFSASTPSSPRVVDHVRLQMRRALAGISNFLPPERQADGFNQLAVQLRKLKTDKEPKMETPVQVDNREEIYLMTARKRILELVAQGKSVDDAATVIASAFKVVHPMSRQELARNTLITNASKTWPRKGGRPPNATTPQPSPQKPVIDLYTAVEKSVLLAKEKGIKATAADLEIFFGYTVMGKKHPLTAPAAIGNLRLKFHPEQRMKNKAKHAEADKAALAINAAAPLPPVLAPIAQPAPSSQARDAVPRPSGDLSGQMRQVLDMNLPEETRKKLLRALLGD